MARYDKYDPKVGGFRAHLATDWNGTTDINKVWPVGLNAAGQVVKGGGQTGVIGVLVTTRAMKAAGEPVDVMTAGEIVEFPTAAAPAAPGTVIYGEGGGDFEVGAIGDVDDGTALPSPQYAVRIGHTVESKTGKGARLVVRVQPSFNAPTGT